MWIRDGSGEAGREQLAVGVVFDETKHSGLVTGVFEKNPARVLCEAEGKYEECISGFGFATDGGQQLGGSLDAVVAPVGLLDDATKTVNFLKVGDVGGNCGLKDGYASGVLQPNAEGGDGKGHDAFYALSRTKQNVV